MCFECTKGDNFGQNSSFFETTPSWVLDFYRRPKLCGGAIALIVKPLLCRFPSPISFGISGSSMGSKILYVVLEPGGLGDRVTGHALTIIVVESRVTRHALAPSCHNCGRALALTIKPLLCHFPSPTGVASGVSLRSTSVLAPERS